MNEHEQLWVDQARTGDAEAFSHLVEAYQRPVFNLAYRMLGNPTEAEDAAQETFLRVYAKLGQYDPERKFSTWILSIANNHCIDRLRKRRVTLLSIDDNPVLQNLEGDSILPEHAVLQREQAQELQALLGKLAPDYRTPLILRYWQEYSYQEIADTMQISLSAVKTRLFRARQQLGEIYQEAQTLQVAVPARSRQPSDVPLFMHSQPALLSR